MWRWIATLLVLTVVVAHPALAAGAAAPATKASLFAGAYSLAPRPVGKIAFVIVAAVVDLFVLVSFISCLTRPVPRRRWRWLQLVLIPFGVGRATLSWLTGMVFFQLFDLHVPSATFSLAAGRVPNSISIGFPLFAFVFWTLRSSWHGERVAESPEPPSDVRLEDEQG